MRLINADALPVVSECCVDEAGFFAKFKVVHEEDVRNASTIDAVPVVRCGECERRDKSADLMYTVMCDYLEAEMPRDGFCNYGKRKDGEGDG